MKTVLVVNPMSADGTTGRDWDRLGAEVREHFPDATEEFTRGEGDATRATREALEGGADLVIGVGGDGTNNEVVNGFFEPDGTPVRAEAQFAFLPRGTGCDFARWLKLPRDVGEASRIVAASEPWPIDVGHLEVTGEDGAPVQRIFLNISDFGIGGMISHRVNSGSKRLGGFLSFLWHTLVSLVVYENLPMEVAFDGGEFRTGKFQSVVFANGRYFGGGMNIAPRALLDDGHFEIVVIPDVTRLDSFRHTPALYSEKGVLDSDSVEYFRAREVVARPGDPARPVWVEMDGESPGRLPMRARVLEGALRLRAPRPPPPAT